MYLYLLKYIPEKELYLQLGYKISIFSEILDSIKLIGNRYNNLDYSLYHVYLGKDFVNIKLHGNIEIADQTTVKKSAQ